MHSAASRQEQKKKKDLFQKRFMEKDWGTNLLPAKHHFKGEAALQRRTWLFSMKDRNQASPWHVHNVWGSAQEKQALPPARRLSLLPPHRALCVQEGLANVIVTACRVRANDESNSHLKRLAEFLSLVFSRTKSVTTFDAPLLCCAARLAFRLLIPPSRCLLGVESEENKKADPWRKPVPAFQWYPEEKNKAERLLCRSTAQENYGNTSK